MISQQKLSDQLGLLSQTFFKKILTKKHQFTWLFVNQHSICPDYFAVNLYGDNFVEKFINYSIGHVISPIKSRFSKKITDTIKVSYFDKVETMGFQVNKQIKFLFFDRIEQIVNLNWNVIHSMSMSELFSLVNRLTNYVFMISNFPADLFIKEKSEKLKSN